MRSVVWWTGQLAIRCYMLELILTVIDSSFPDNIEILTRLSTWEVHLASASATTATALSLRLLIAE
jgi:hypothetical protein